MAEVLSSRTCTPCRGGIPPLPRPEAERLLASVPRWKLMDEGARIERSFEFPDFAQALTFVDRVGALSEREGHHPEVAFGWGWARVSWQTMKIGGLHENDFIMAAKTDEAFAADDSPL